MKPPSASGYAEMPFSPESSELTAAGERSISGSKRLGFEGPASFPQAKDLVYRVLDRQALEMREASLLRHRARQAFPNYRT